jgi:hypothetical protein
MARLRIFEYLRLIMTCAAAYTAILFVIKEFTASEIRFFSGFLTRER